MLLFYPWGIDLYFFSFLARRRVRVTLKDKLARDLTEKHAS